MAAYGRNTANIVNNYDYGVRGNHPSEYVVAYDNTRQREVFMDQVLVVGTPSQVATSEYAMTPEAAPYVAEYKKRGFAGDGGGHLFGYATCHWIRHCNGASDRLGSACQATLSGVVYKGYCFKSDEDTLECGHLTALDDAWGNTPRTFDGSTNINTPAQAGVVQLEGGEPAATSMPSSPGVGPAYRCPTGSPARSLGYFVSKRMLFAGCMISSDANYDALAEVHVPAYCASPADYNKGCLLPSALNYDPIAKQSGECLFHTKGCISRTAINFNPYATITDPFNAACVETRVGCTVRSEAYYGVDAGTPEYASGFYGSAAEGAGGPLYMKVHQSAFASAAKAVLAYDPIATVNSGCIVAVEGCMDSTARNYDPLATVNSNSWCVPIVEGCMLPSAPYASGGYANPEAAASNTRVIPGGIVDGLSGNFSLSTTMHRPALCTEPVRYGCGTPGKVNYDPLANVHTFCYSELPGCLNAAAVNYGCASYDDTSTCTLPEAERVTTHVPGICRWELSPPSPPNPPPPPTPPTEDFNVAYVVELGVRVLMTISEAEAKRGDFAAQFRSLTGLAADVEVTVAFTPVTSSSGRRLSAAATELDVTMSASLPDAAGAESASSTLTAAVGTSRSSLQASFGDALGVTVTRPATVTVQVVSTPNTDPAGVRWPEVIIALLLLILLCAGIGGGFYWAKKQVDRSPVKVMPHRKPPAGQDEIEDAALTNVPP